MSKLHYLEKQIISRSPVFKSTDDFKNTVITPDNSPFSKIVEEGFYYCQECKELIDTYYKFRNACLFDNETIYCYACYHIFDDCEIQEEDVINNNDNNNDNDVYPVISADKVRGLCIKCSKPFPIYCSKCESKKKFNQSKLKIIIDKNRLHPNTIKSTPSTSPLSSRSGGSWGATCANQSAKQHQRNRSSSNFLTVGPENFYKNIIRAK